MIRHLFRLAWNRKWRNGLLLIELLVSFLVVSAICVLVAHVVNNARKPLGFTIDRVWSIEVRRNIATETRTPESDARDRARFRQLAFTLKEMPQIEAAAEGMTGPYGTSNWGLGLNLEDSRSVFSAGNRASDDFAEVLGIRPVVGRWFQPDDESANWQPVILNRRLAEEVFGTIDVVGRIIPEMAEPERRANAPIAPSAFRRPKRVVGVVEDFRQAGEPYAPGNYMFIRETLADLPLSMPLPEVFLVRLRDGTTRAFEETLVKRLEAIAPGWSFGVTTLEEDRQVRLQIFTLPLVVVGAIAAALLLMVALGLTGVVWQSVTQRTSEFGLRRANGATAGNVRWHVVAELVTLTTMAVGIGCALIAQLAFLPLPRDVAAVPLPIAFLGLAIAIGIFYGVTILSSLYPSRLATRLPPAEALHYE